jgi:mRNA-degrading endonuclease toxin of MazEF toxin-antitoxin module
MNRGDIVLVRLPPPAGPSGTEQFGTRPAVVVQDEGDFGNLSTVLIVPLTSRLSVAQFPSTFAISPSAANGLDVESVVLTHQLRAIDRRRIQRVIGVLPDHQMAALQSQIRRLLRL